MKFFEINILILLIVFIQLSGYAQSEKKIIGDALIIPLKNGKNQSVQYETMVIEPVNLFIQSKPINKSNLQIQLELNVVQGHKKYTTFLRNYAASNSYKKVNYPKAYQNYSFGLDINNEEVGLVIKKLALGEAMFIDLGQTAVIGNLTILFEDCMGEWSVDINGNQTDAFNTYHILLSEANEQKTMSFMSLNKYVEKELSIDWKEYKILILEDAEKTLKLMVFKNNAKKKGR